MSRDTDVNGTWRSASATRAGGMRDVEGHGREWDLALGVWDASGRDAGC